MRRRSVRRHHRPAFLASLSLAWGICAASGVVAAQPSGSPPAETPKAADAPPAPTGQTAEPEPGQRDVSPVKGLSGGGQKPELQEAERHFRAGIELYRQGLYRSARAEFEEAYRLSKLPDLLYNIAHTLRYTGQFKEALEFYDRYLLAAPGAVDFNEVHEAMTQLRREVALADREELGRAQAAQARAAAKPAPRAALGLLIGGGVVLAAGVGCGLGAVGASRAVASSERFDVGLDRSGRALETAGLALDVVGGAALLAGGIYYGVAKKQRRGSDGSRPMLAVGPGSLYIAGEF